VHLTKPHDIVERQIVEEEILSESAMVELNRTRLKIRAALCGGRRVVSCNLQMKAGVQSSSNWHISMQCQAWEGGDIDVPVHKPNAV